MKKNSDVDIAFMLDATSSMELNLEAVEKNIEEVVMRVKDTFFNIKVRVALVAYRDYSEAALHFEIMDFTEDVTEFINFIIPPTPIIISLGKYKKVFSMSFTTSW